MAKIRRFETGIEYIMNKIVTSTEKPYVISINGQPNSGKTELRKILNKYAYHNNKKIWSGMGGAYNNCPEFSTETDCCFIEDITHWPAVSAFSKDYFGKEADIRIYMVLSRNEIQKRHHQEYDMIILNPKAKIKRL